MSESESLTSRKIKKPARLSSPSTKRCGFKWKIEKKPTAFYCKICDCNLSNKYKLEKHYISEKHKQNLTGYPKSEPVYSCICTKTFKKSENLKKHIENFADESKHKEGFGWDVSEEAKISESDDLEITKKDIEELKNILSDDNKKKLDEKTELTNDDLQNFFDSLSDEEFNNIFSCLEDGKRKSRKSKRKKSKTKSKKRKSKKYKKN
jgi:hypothetical protein